MISGSSHSRQHTKRILKNFESEMLKKRPVHVRLADSFTILFGTALFLFLNILIFSFWFLANSGKIPGITSFDPFPYSFLNSVVSIEAIILTIIVLISQNSQNRANTIKSELQLQVNLITEKEITMALRLLKKIADARQIKVDDPELDEMLKDTDTSYIERKLELELDRQESITQEVASEISKKEEEIERTILGNKPTQNAN